MAEMQTYSARLASFNKAHPATKKRTSEAKGAKSLKWPHKSPTSAQLAKAGFYYHPTTSCLDNATCFNCQSNLDGWERDDDPIVEHLKHSPACGWAITMYIEQNIESGNPIEENPLSESMLSARMMTFGAQWPHESKRGWTCKTQKMVDAGWYYCPTPESDDFVRCAYCNLSLDGWEPKDNAYDEHQRRSPDCIFFTLSSLAKSKPGRPKKSRTSKASRMSTASNITAVSEAPSVTDCQENEGNTTLASPTGSLKSAKTEKGSKKVRKAKKSTTKPKSQLVSTTTEEPAQTSSFIEPEDDDFEVKVEANHKKSTRGRKRNSDGMSVNNGKVPNKDQRDENEVHQPPPAKRRATRTRSSIAQSTNAPISVQENHDDDVHMTDAENAPPPSLPVSKKGTKGSRKRASSAVRKASATSTASMASLRSAIPNDEDIDAALEADLDSPLTDDENNAEQLEVLYPKTRRLTRTKPGSRNPTASVAPVRRTTRTSVMTTSDVLVGDGSFSQSTLPVHDSAVEAVSKSEFHMEKALPTRTVKTKTTKGKNARKASAKQPNAKDTNATQEEHIINSSVVLADEPPLIPKPSRTREPSRQLPQRSTRASDLATALENVNLSSPVNKSMLEALTTEGDSGHETDRSVASQSRGKPGRNRGSVTASKGRAGKKAPLKSRKIEDVVHLNTGDPSPVEEPEIAMGIDYLTPAEPENTVTGSVEEATKPKKKSAKSTKAKASKPTSKKAEPSEPPSPQAESSKHLSPDYSAPSNQLAETDGNSPNPADPDHKAMSVPAEIPASSPALLLSTRATPKPASPRQSSDAENEPPSSRPSKLRHPLSTSSPPKSQTVRIPLAASTPTSSPSKRNMSKLHSSFPWTATAFEKFFGPADGDKENDASVVGTTIDGLEGGLPSPEKQMTVEQWILSNAKKSEEKLRTQCERLVGKFECEGVRALKTLEALACVD